MWVLLKSKLLMKANTFTIYLFLAKAILNEKRNASSKFKVLAWFDSFRPINNLSVKQGRVFLGWTGTKLG